MADLEISPPFDPDELPLEMEDEDMSFDLLEHVMPGDHVYFALGSAISEFYGFDPVINNDVEGIMILMTLLGELADKPGKVDSKTDRLKTRNYQIQGKRTSSIEINLNGLSTKMKNYLESALFQEQDITILITDADLATMEPLTDPGYRCLLFDAMRWAVDWSAEADGLWSVVISTSVDGSTASKILPFTSEIDPET